MALVGLEAAGAGLAILTTRVNGAEDLVTDGVNGLFVEPDAADVALKLRLLITQPALRHRLAESARLSSAGHTPSAVARQVLEVCAEGVAAPV